MLLSRLAEHVYWAGRYLERAESTARLLRVHTELYLDMPRSVSSGWRPLLAVTGSADTFEEVGGSRDEGVVATEEHQIVKFLTTNLDHPGSVLACLTAARLNLRSVRALIPRSGWEVANSLLLWAKDEQDLAVPRRSRVEWLDEIVRRCQTLAGLLDGTMSHDQSYAFMKIGRHLERADMTTRVIDVQSQVLLGHRIGDGTLPYADVTWMGVLKSVSAMQMFRRVENAGVSGKRALRFLLCNPQFPRSVDHCLTELSRRLLELPRHEEAMAACAASQRVLVDGPLDGLSGAELHDLMDELQRSLGRIHTAASTTWFAPPAMVTRREDPRPRAAAGQTQTQRQRVS